MIHICEVGPRDGLQNEKKILTTEEKVNLIQKLIDAGIKKFEAVSFVNPKVIPQMADAEEVIKHAPKVEGVNYAGLVLSKSALDKALKTDIHTIHIVLATSDEFNMRNARRTVEQSLKELTPLISEGIKSGKDVVCALGTSFGCPFEGDVPVERLLKISEAFLNEGASGITLADTTGLANPKQVTDVVKLFKNEFGDDMTLGLHFHNTRGLGLANVLAGNVEGVRHFDSSIGGLGGCPFAPKAVGNVCTEDMVNMFEQMGESTETSLEKLVRTAQWLESVMDKQLDGMMMKVFDE